jgi:hypothetical protein
MALLHTSRRGQRILMSGFSATLKFSWAGVDTWRGEICLPAGGDVCIQSVDIMLGEGSFVE